jgi:2-polyprenyl-6-methoxyphenol hydroxylase-like FAD-dependent oxidoreductase
MAAQANGSYDIIIIGGGLGGSTLAKAMAEHGARVLVLECQKRFKDRVRGEVMVPWGVAEVRELGIDGLLRDSGGRELAWLDRYTGAVRGERRDFVATTPQRMPSFAFYHPTLQEVLLQAAGHAGAEVRRGSWVCAVKSGEVPAVTVEHDGRVEELHARLVVGADGRASLVRHQVGFPVHRDPEQLRVAGVLLEHMDAIEDSAFYIVSTPGLGAVVLVPQGQDRVRAYLGWYKDGQDRLQGEQDLPRFIDGSVKIGASPEWYAGTRIAGPLATFDGADTWVEHPYKEGVALIGDAAAANDPMYGQGLSLTVRDVRVLRDALFSHEDWDMAGHAYAAEHDRYYGVIHAVTCWLTELFYVQEPTADVRRARVLPLLAQDSTRIPDHIFSGPELPADETVRRRFFGEE